MLIGHPSHNRFLLFLFVLNPENIILKNGRTYCKNLALQAPEDFKNMLDHFSTLCIKGLISNQFLANTDK